MADLKYKSNMADLKYIFNMADLKYIFNMADLKYKRIAASNCKLNMTDL